MHTDDDDDCLRLLTPADHAIVRSRGDGRLFVTDRGQWWYLATADLRDLASPVAAVNLEMYVSGGSVGISIVGDDETAIEREVVVGAGQYRKVRIATIDGVAPSRLIIRSTDSREHPAVVHVTSLRMEYDHGLGEEVNRR